MTVTDALARPLRDLRISVTDVAISAALLHARRSSGATSRSSSERAADFEEIERLARISSATME